MSIRLLIAGVVITALAIKTDHANRQRAAHSAADTIESASMHDVSVVKRGLAVVSSVFEGGLKKATEQSLVNSHNTLTRLEPAVRKATGENGAEARLLVKEARTAIDRAQAQLAEGKTMVALDFALQASSRAGQLRSQFERR